MRILSSVGSGCSPSHSHLATERRIHRTNLQNVPPHFASATPHSNHPSQKLTSSLLTTHPKPQQEPAITFPSPSDGIPALLTAHLQHTAQPTATPLNPPSPRLITNSQPPPPTNTQLEAYTQLPAPNHQQTSNFIPPQGHQPNSSSHTPYGTKISGHLSIAPPSHVKLPTWVVLPTPTASASDERVVSVDQIRTRRSNRKARIRQSRLGVSALVQPSAKLLVVLLLLLLDQFDLTDFMLPVV